MLNSLSQQFYGHNLLHWSCVLLGGGGIPILMNLDAGPGWQLTFSCWCPKLAYESKRALADELVGKVTGIDGVVVVVV